MASGESIIECVKQWCWQSHKLFIKLSLCVKDGCLFSFGMSCMGWKFDCFFYLYSVVECAVQHNWKFSFYVLWYATATKQNSRNIFYEAWTSLAFEKLDGIHEKLFRLIERWSFKQLTIVVFWKCVHKTILRGCNGCICTSVMLLDCWALYQHIAFTASCKGFSNISFCMPVIQIKHCRGCNVELAKVRCISSIHSEAGLRI